MVLEEASKAYLTAIILTERSVAEAFKGLSLFVSHGRNLS